MTASAGLNSVLPIVSFYLTLIIFGFLSWFHFFKPRIGAMLLTIFIVVRFLSWPLILFVEYFKGEYRPSMLEALVPPALSIVTIIFVWKGVKKDDLNPYLKIALAIPAAVIGLYTAWIFTSRFFFL
jgi:hypothetical protein